MEAKPAEYPMARVKQGLEPEDFTSQFEEWEEEEAIVDMSPEAQKKRLSDNRQASSKSSLTVAHASLAKQQSTDELVNQMVATKEELAKKRKEHAQSLVRGKLEKGGELTTWRLHDSKFRERLPAWTENSMLDAGDAYVVRYVWLSGTITSAEAMKKQTAIFGWKGRQVTQMEKGSLALQLDQVAHEAGGEIACNLQISMNAEPPAFLELFGGKLIIRDPTVSKSKKAEDKRYDGCCLFKVHGVDSSAVHSYEVADEAASLSSGDVFLLQTKGTVYVWRGEQSSKEERAIAMDAAGMLSRQLAGEATEDGFTTSWEVLEVAEGSEPDSFWASLVGGKQTYSS